MKEIILEENEFLKILCRFKKDELLTISNYQTVNPQYSKSIWALFGKNKTAKSWQCIEVGSSINIKNEINGIIALFKKTPQKIIKKGIFYQDEDIGFEFWTYHDRVSCKYRKIAQMFEEYCFCEIDIDKYIENQYLELNILKLKINEKYPQIKKIDFVNYTEVSFALKTKAIFWHPAPATYHNQEKYLLEILMDDMMDFRLATINDLSQIKKMYYELIKVMNENNLKIWNNIYPIEFFKEDIEKKRLYVLIDQKQVIVSAFALCLSSEGEKFIKWQNNSNKVLYLERLGVNPKYQKMKIGSWMLLKAREIAKAKGIEYLRLFVVDDNIGAINFYQRNSFIKKDGQYNEVISSQKVLSQSGFEIKID